MRKRHDYVRVGWENSRKEKLANETCGSEREVDAALLHCLQSFCRDFNRDFAVEFRDKDGLFLEVNLAAARAGWREFSCAGAVGIPASDAALFACNHAFSGHMSGNYTILGGKMQRVIF